MGHMGLMETIYDSPGNLLISLKWILTRFA